MLKFFNILIVVGIVLMISKYAIPHLVHAKSDSAILGSELKHGAEAISGSDCLST